MAELKSRLYKLALWYIRKCNAEWNKRSFKNELEALDRLTYWNFGKYMLTYGADAEWQIFSRYEVLDNAIQKLAKYEDATTTEAEDIPIIHGKAELELHDKVVRAMAIDEFAELLLSKLDVEGRDWYCARKINEVAEQLKEE